MPITFTPKFFSQSTTTPTVAISHPVSGVASHGIPGRQTSQRVSPITQSSSLSNASQHYADIDWTKRESIMQDGSRVKFGAPRVAESHISPKPHSVL
jgi:hypothetical protein